MWQFSGLLPTLHAWRALTKLRLRRHNLVDPIYSTATWRTTYAWPIPTIVKDDLVPNPNCGPPLTRRRSGYPNGRSNQRFGDEYVVRLPRRCQHCLERGHDRRNCHGRIIENIEVNEAGETLEVLLSDLESMDDEAEPSNNMG